MTKAKAKAALQQHLDDHFLVQTDYINCNNWSIETGKGNEIIWTIEIPDIFTALFGDWFLFAFRAWTSSRRKSLRQTISYYNMYKS